MAAATTTTTTTSLRSLRRYSHPHFTPNCTHFRLSLNNPSPILTAAALSPSNPTTAVTGSSDPTSLDSLARHLEDSNLREADEETRRLLIALAGEAAVKRGYVFFSEVKFIEPESLRAIDRLWRENSGDKFGYSVQKKIWEKKAKRDFTKFFIAVGWMKKLDTEVEQWNYRSFPSEFIWEMSDDIPEGHLPLTNALRGTQLLTSIFTHPAFEDDEGQESDGEVEQDNSGLKERSGLLGGRMKLKPADYSF